MNTDDYAILVGIDVYPELGADRTPANLGGPLNDVTAIKAWLTNPSEGGVPPENIIEIGPADRRSVATGQPDSGAVHRLLDDLYTRRQGAARAQFGRRVYLYMSGHGFSLGATKVCLYTADARLDFTENIHITSWLTWLQDAGYFREYVLWVDACMDRNFSSIPNDTRLKPTNARVPPLANFVAFAAQRPLKALELPIVEEDGTVHGAFTWTVLQGLRGAAVDKYGRVTGRSLADWVRNAMAARYDERDRADTTISKEPQVVAEDASLVFARGLVAPSYALRLQFPAAAIGARATIWTGCPPVVARTLDVTHDTLDLALPPGLYVLATERGQLRHGFEVLTPCTVHLGKTGPRVGMYPGGVYKLDIDPGDLSAEIFVIGDRFSLVDFNYGRLATALPPGVFKVKVRIGNALSEEVILLDADYRAGAVAGQAALPSTVIPLPDTAATHETHQQARAEAVAATVDLALPDHGASLMLMVRTFSSRTAPVADTVPPWRGVQVVDAAGEIIIDMDSADHTVRSPGPDGVAYAAAAVPPGCYYLRQRLDAGAIVPGGPGTCPIEQSVIACSGWRTEVYIMRRVLPGASAVESRPRIAIAMRHHSELITDAIQAEDRLAETARLAMAGERRVLNEELEEALMVKSGNPIAAMIGAHLLLIEQARDPGRDISRLPTVVANLRRLLGDGHPDVAALAQRCGGRKPTAAIVGPPMFQNSWVLLAQAAKRRPRLIPAAMWARVLASSGLPPFMVWTTDADLKLAAQRRLAQVLFRDDAAPPLPDGPPAPAGYRGLPQDAEPVRAPRVAMPPFARASRVARERAAALHLPPSAFDVLADAMHGRL